MSIHLCQNRRADKLCRNIAITCLKRRIKSIFYLLTLVAQAETSPHLEGYRARDIDVLLLTDPVDEFWVQAVGSFDEKPLTSISRGSQNLDDIALKKDEVDDQKYENQDEEFVPLIASLKSKLGEQVKDVS